MEAPLTMVVPAISCLQTAKAYTLCIGLLQIQKKLLPKRHYNGTPFKKRYWVKNKMFPSKIVRGCIFMCYVSVKCYVRS